jgi:hypothetical protein
MKRLHLKTTFAALIVCAWVVHPIASSAAEPMKVDLVQDLHWKDHHFVMSNWFYKYQFRNPELQIKLLKERGYGGVMLTLKDDPGRWKMLPRYLAALKKHDMRLTAIHARFYIEDGTYPQVIKDNLPLLEDTKVVLVPSVGSRKLINADLGDQLSPGLAGSFSGAGMGCPSFQSIGTTDRYHDFPRVSLP